MCVRGAEPWTAAPGGPDGWTGPRDEHGIGTSERVANAIAAEPGIHKSALARRLNIGWGTLIHHVDRLRRKKRIQTVRQGGRCLLFPLDIAARDARRMALLRDDVSCDLVHQLETLPQRRVQELSSAVQASTDVVRARLASLVDQGLVRRTGPGQTLYEVEDEVLDHTRRLMEQPGSSAETAEDGAPLGCAQTSTAASEAHAGQPLEVGAR